MELDSCLVLCFLFVAVLASLHTSHSFVAIDLLSYSQSAPLTVLVGRLS